MSVVPDVPRDDALTPGVQSEIEEWDDSTFYPDSVLGLAEPVFDRGFPEMGMMVYTELVEVDGRFRTPAAVRGYRELHADGSGFAALLLRDAPDTAEPWDLKEDQLVDTLAALTVHMLSWTTFRAGQWGNATVKAGIIGGDNLDGRFRTSIRLVDGTGGSFGGRGLRLVRRQPRTEALAHLEELGTTQNKLRIAYSVTSRILQSFGVVEPRWLSDSGAVDVTEMLRDQKFPARQWAEEHGVELVDRNRRTHR